MNTESDAERDVNASILSLKIFFKQTGIIIHSKWKSSEIYPSTVCCDVIRSSFDTDCFEQEYKKATSSRWFIDFCFVYLGFFLFVYKYD